MDYLTDLLCDRSQEINTYLDLLEALEEEVQQGPPRFGENGPTISPQQQRILYSSVFIQLYNMVEATITNCIDTFTNAIVSKGPWKPSDLTPKLRSEWVRCIAKTHHAELNSKNRLKAAVIMCEHLVDARPVSPFKVESGRGGNWDDHSIQEITTRLGMSLSVSSQVKSGVKRPFRNDEGPLVYIRKLRNELAHGSMSFAECGEGVTVADLRRLTGLTTSYLTEVVSSFQASIDRYEFLSPQKRPN